MTELRAATRQSTARTGIIEFDGARGAVSIPCTICDVSGTGARLKLDWSLSFPKDATLIFADGLRKTCRVAWQKRRLLGVAFADGVASPDEQALMMTEEEQALHRRHIGAQVKARGKRAVTPRLRLRTSLPPPPSSCHVPKAVKSAFLSTSSRTLPIFCWSISTASLPVRRRSDWCRARRAAAISNLRRSEDARRSQCIPTRNCTRVAPPMGPMSNISTFRPSSQIKTFCSPTESRR